MKNIKLLTFFSFIIQIGYTQSAKLDVKGQTLWLKGKREEKIDEKQIVNGYFNFNPIYNYTNKKLIVKNILQSKYSLFAVFQNNEKEEKLIASLHSNVGIITITNKKIETGKEIKLKKINPENGIILTCLSSSDLKIKKPNRMTIEPILKNEDSKEKNKLLELIYYPRVLTAIEKQKIETYLSIKYGISLLGAVDYINSDNTKIWDIEKNSDYNKRVTGIERDDKMSLNQMQSSNAEKDGLYIGFVKNDNEDNAMVIDKTSLVWGDNGLVTTFSNENNSNGVRKMERVWKIQVNNLQHKEILRNTLEIKKSAFETQNKTVMLVISEDGSSELDYTKAKFYEPNIENAESFIYKNIVWDKDKSGSDLFSFIEAPDFFATINIEKPNCNLSKNGFAKIKIVGGIAPYIINLKSINDNKSYTTKNEFINFENLNVGSYQLEIKDLKNNYKSNFDIYSFKDNNIEIEPVYYLINNEVEIVPKTALEDDISEYNWSLNKVSISKERKIIATEMGNYNLKVTNKWGCTKDFEFKVKAKENSFDGQWILTPNPVKSSQEFSILFKLAETKTVSIAITDMSGKLIKSKNLWSIKNYQFNETLETSGTYLITLTLGEEIETTKLIVE